jgi:non-ribosomal peptide synthetase component F
VIADQTLNGDGVRKGTRRPHASRVHVHPTTLNAMFTRTAHRHPAGVAVQEGAGHLTYGRAEIRATQLASALVRNGVQLGDPVIVHCDDHRQTVVAHLAVLKAGGVCVPVSPQERHCGVGWIAAISGARAVLCSVSTQSVWARGGPTLTLDDAETWNKVSALRVDPSLPRSDALDAAYLLISAEAGISAQGRLVDHRAWQLAMASRIQQVGAADHTVTVRHAPMGAPTLSAMWWAFASGGTLRTRPRDSELVHSIAWGGASAGVFSPDEYGLVLEAVVLASGPVGPRSIVLIGEACPRELVERHFEVLPATKLWAEFAPAGGIMPWAVQEFLPHGSPDGPDLGVGSPVPNVHVQVLDPDGRALPPGQIGEVCAEGPALAFGSVRAISHGLPLPDSGPLLRSGRLGRWGTDGTLDITGPAESGAPATC